MGIFPASDRNRDSVIQLGNVVQTRSQLHQHLRVQTETIPERQTQSEGFILVATEGKEETAIFILMKK